MRIVVTVVGQDKVGIIAKVTNILANNQVNVLNINQNIMDGFFNMVLIADMTDSKVGIKTLKEHLGHDGFQGGHQDAERTPGQTFGRNRAGNSRAE